MSPSSVATSTAAPVAARVPVTIAADAGIETFIIDHRFDLAGRGAGSWGLDLVPGVYKLKFRAGNVTREQLLLVDGERPAVHADAPPMPFASAAPLSDTALADESHAAAAAAESARVHVERGGGAEIFVMARQWSRKPLDVRGSDPATGLSLHATDGSLVADLLVHGARDLAAARPWSACTARVTPGHYRLRLRRGEDDVLEQSIVAANGWQTRIFLGRRVPDDPTSHAHAVHAPVEIGSSSLLMGRLGTAFDAASPDARSADLGRLNLAHRRSPCARAAADRLVATSDSDPMQGIYAAHALLAHDEDHELARAVVARCREQLGAHPDIDALALALDVDDREARHAFPTPPMLVRGLDEVIRRSVAMPWIVPSGSVTARASYRLCQQGPWSVWRLDARFERATPSSRRALVGTVLLLIEALGKLPRDRHGRPKPPEELTCAEAGLFTAVAPALAHVVAGGLLMLGRSNQRWVHLSLDAARALHVPPSAVPEVLVDTLDRIQHALGSRHGEEESTA